jgi:tetratricopeptide (TPR) repeat protein
MFLGRNLSWLGRYDEAIAALKKALELTPDSLESVAFLAAALAGKGDRKGSLKLVKDLTAAEARTEPAILLAIIYARLGLPKELFESLDRAVAVKSTPIYVVLLSDEFRPFRTDPRYLAFLGSIGLSHLASN